jgi:hypothetical protein
VNAAKNWQQTQLWKALQKKAQNSTMCGFTTQVLNDAEELLSHSGTAPLNFTLHDADHSFRVAEWMVKIIPQEVCAALSETELAYLLQAAFFHDLGMNPENKEVEEVRTYLLETLDHLSLSDEGAILRHWLDDNYPDYSAQLEACSSAKKIELVGEILSYYCRDRHNAWSADLIKQVAAGKSPPSSGWLNEIILLCQSHHYSFAELMDASFDARPDQNGEALNLRYLAAVLRLADVLDFDPERTPSVIFSHRKVTGKSCIYWYKDHEIRFTLNRDNHKALLYARTPDAWIHRAVLETANWVDTELKTCALISYQGGFEPAPVFKSAKRYDWPWASVLVRDIRPLPNTFEYIDGTFRPDTNRVLSLLGGTQLYGNPLAAARELVQNAFDAVRVLVAVDLLAAQKHDVETRRQVEKGYSVSLSLTEREEELWIVCADDGVGMTREVIENSFLVSGARERSEFKELQRKCERANIVLEKSGEFGIGALAYFMLADELIFETRAVHEAHVVQETNGWRFETQGVSSFGELRPIPRQKRGTTVYLRVRREMRKLVSEKLLEYLGQEIVYAPCNFKIEADNVLNYSPGWLSPPGTLLRPLFERIFPTPYRNTKWITQETKTKEAERKVSRSRLVAKAHSLLRFFPPEEGELPNGLGLFRLTIPYYMLEGGPSLTFMDVEEDLLRPVHVRPDPQFFSPIRTAVKIGWRCFRINADLEEPEHDLYMPGHLPVIREVDLKKGGVISVDRRSFRHPLEDEIESFLIDTETAYLRKFALAFSGSKYSVLDDRWQDLIQEESRLGEGNKHWIFPETATSGSRSFKLRPARFPALLVPDAGMSELLKNPGPDRDDPFRDRLVVLEPLDEALWPLPEFQPSRLVVETSGYRIRGALVFEETLSKKTDDRLMVEFPPNWETVLACETTSASRIFNKNHVLLKFLPTDKWRRLKEMLGELYAEELAARATENTDLAAAFMIKYAHEEGEFWNGFRDTHPKQFQLLFEQLKSLGVASIRIWMVTGSSRGFRTIDDGGSRFAEWQALSTCPLPIPADERWVYGGRQEQGDVR